MDRGFNLIHQREAHFHKSHSPRAHAAQGLTSRGTTHTGFQFRGSHTQMGFTSGHYAFRGLVSISGYKDGIGK